MRARVSSLYEQTRNQSPSVVMGGWRSLLLCRWDTRRINRQRSYRYDLVLGRPTPSIDPRHRHCPPDSNDSAGYLLRLLPRLERAREVVEKRFGRREIQTRNESQ